GLGAEKLLQCVQLLDSGQLPPAIPQAAEGVSYAHKLDKAEAEIDWNDTAGQLERRIRAFNPWPVCWCDIAGERCRIWMAHAEPMTQPWPASEVLRADADGIVVACAEGQLRLTQLQRPGGRPQSAQEFLQQRPMPARLVQQL
ncbi:MAG TPA: methionyl-tRNA formyltransferase, partial [Xanthomonadales bacterium]|nr:methionyl-tRNA formyltransferase [Xanthomonadales bacterium]